LQAPSETHPHQEPSPAPPPAAQKHISARLCTQILPVPDSLPEIGAQVAPEGARQYGLGHDFHALSRFCGVFLGFVCEFEERLDAADDFELFGEGI